MAHRLLQDPDADGWERSDFPIVCETCLGPNPYVRMQRMEFGGECHISGRPYTKFRWRPGSDARYKSTIICQEVAKAKNVCQVCLLDLEYNLPVQVRDQALAESGAQIEQLPESDVGKEFALNRMAQEGQLESSFSKGKDNDTIMRLQRTTPYYKRNKAQICSFFVRGECKRGAECPYRHEMPTSGPLADQNIKDRYYGVNDPVANKMMERVSTAEKLEPPEDTTITTFYIGNLQPSMHEDDIREPFLPFGEVQSVRKLDARHCAFVTFADRAAAEKAAEALSGRLFIQGQRCRLLWGRPQADRTQAAGAAAPYRPAMLPPQVQLQREPGAAPGALAPVQGDSADGTAASGAPAAAPPQQQQFVPIVAAAPGNFFGLPSGTPGAPMYPSMDSQAMGTRGQQPLGKRPADDAAGGPGKQQRTGPGGAPGGPPQQGGFRPPPGFPPHGMPPPGMLMRPPPSMMMPPPGPWMQWPPPGAGPPPGFGARPPQQAAPPAAAPPATL